MIMLITILGCVGIGLIWGWWIGNLDGRITHPMLYRLALGIESLALAIYIYILVGWEILGFFLSASGLALCLHLAWRQELRTRLGSPKI